MKSKRFRVAQDGRTEQRAGQDIPKTTTTVPETPSHKGEHHDSLPTDRSIRAVAQIEQKARESRSHVDYVAATITRMAGSGPVILLHAIWFSIWVVANLNGLPGIKPFDPFPFSLLTMIVSLEVIFLTLFVLASQNRMSQEADKRAQLELQVNLLAEQETTMILRMLQEMSEHWGLKGRASQDLQELLKETKLDELADKLEGALPPD